MESSQEHPYSSSFIVVRLSGAVEQSRVRIHLKFFALILAGFLTILVLSSTPIFARQAESGGDSSSNSAFLEAQNLSAQKKWPEAVIVLRNILKQNPKFAAASVSFARALAYSGRREEALSVLSRATSLHHGETRDLLIRQSRVLSRMFFSTRAFQIHQEGMNLLLSKKYRPAREQFMKALELEPDNAEILVRVGQCLILEGDFDSAAERLRLARKLSPNEPEIHLWLGRALHQRGEVEPAIVELKQANREISGSEVAPVWLAEALATSGSIPSAIQVLEEDLKQQPFHVLGLLTLARLRFDSVEHPVEPLGSRTRDRSKENLWSARKDLQVAMSRFSEYSTNSPPKSEGELGLDLRSPEVVLEEIRTLIKRVDDRIEVQSAKG